MKKQTNNIHSDKVGDKGKMPRRFYLLSSIFYLLAVSGCSVLSYTSPSGERFVRSSVGTSISISSLSFEGGTNGLRRVQLQGYQNDGSQALGTVTEAAVKAAVSAAK